VAAADRLLLSKTDLVDDCTPLRLHLQALNAGTPILDSRDIHSGDQLLLGAGLRSAEPAAEVRRWQLHRTTTARHGAAQVCCLSFDRPLDWVGFGVWLSMLLRCHGERILRVKGLLNVNASSARHRHSWCAALPACAGPPARVAGQRPPFAPGVYPARPRPGAAAPARLRRFHGGSRHDHLKSPRYVGDLARMLARAGRTGTGHSPGVPGA
jgi:hypothetical protein